MDEFGELLSIIKYEQVSLNNFQVNKRLESLLTTQSCFWEDPSNCKYSLNNKFNIPIIIIVIIIPNEQNVKQRPY